MGYFSNGTSGADYFVRYCARCVHDTNEDCPIWSAHLAYVGSKDNAQSVLDMLIPRSKDGLSNEACLLFIERDTTGDMFASAES